jgi:hypothetical protein
MVNLEWKLSIVKLMVFRSQGQSLAGSWLRMKAISAVCDDLRQWRCEAVL